MSDTKNGNGEPKLERVVPRRVEALPDREEDHEDRDTTFDHGPVEPEAPVSADVLADKDKFEVENWLPQNFVREPFGTYNAKLSYPKRPGFVRHWFNDTPDRVARAQRAGYRKVSEGGKPVRRVVGTTADGKGLSAFLLEIPRRFYDDDMRRARAPADETDAAIRRGTLGEKAGDNRYVPKDGIRIDET